MTAAKILFVAAAVIGMILFNDWLERISKMRRK